MGTPALKRQTSLRNNKQGILVVAIIVIVVAVAIIAILLSGNRSTGQLDFSGLPQSRTADGGFVLGNPEAPITIIEFADFACSHCQEYHATVMTRFVTDYVVTGKAKFEYRIVPTAGGQLSYYTGQLLECAENQKAGSFWKGYDLMHSYVAGGRYTQDVGRVLANDLGLNYSDLLSCSSDAKQVQTDMNLSSQMGIQGTPATMFRYDDGAAQFITYNGITYNQGAAPYAVLAAVVDAVQ